ncbi:MAG: hypothetical protein ACKPDM_14900, partial [Dolichospermum sp.]
SSGDAKATSKGAVFIIILTKKKDMINKSCLNCVWSGFVIEKDGELYGYEGVCFLGLVQLTEVWGNPMQMDDIEELRIAKQPIFEDTANKCRSYKQTGIGKPE